MVDGCTVQDTGQYEVAGLGDLTVHEGLVEGDAQFVTDAQDTVGGLRLTERTRTLHILGECYLLAVLVNLIQTECAYRYYAEGIITVRE